MAEGKQPRAVQDQHDVDPDVGSIVLIQDIDGRQRFAVVMDVEKHHTSSRTTSPRYYVVMPNYTGRWVDQTWRWVDRRVIVDTAPSCSRCQMSRWYWLKEGMVDCEVCHPADVDWHDIWGLVASLTDDIMQDDPRFEPVRAAVQQCDEAFAADNGVEFQKHFLKLVWTVQDYQWNPDSWAEEV